MAACIPDLDRFELVKDRSGHDTGDAMPVEAIGGSMQIDGLGCQVDLICRPAGTPTRARWR